MLELGVYYGKGPVFLRDIAKREDISEKYLSQIIIPLKSAGLVDSIRGAHGGYMLAKPPKKITMREIVEVLEGSLNLVECVRTPSKCARVSQCITRDLWSKLSESITKTLDKVTLDGLVKDYREKKGQMVDYHI